MITSDSAAVMSETERMASSLPGTGTVITSGSALVSTMATTGMPSLLASATAIFSFLASTTKRAPGRRPIPLMPSRFRLSFTRSRSKQQLFLLGVVLEVALRRSLLQLAQPADLLLQGLEVGEHAAQPPLGDVEGAAGLRLGLHDGLELLLGADEEHALALEDHALEELLGLADLTQGLLEIDDVDAGALGEDEAPHLGVPPAGLVTEVDTGFEQVLQLGLCHAFDDFPSELGLVRPPRSSPAATRAGHPQPDPAVCEVSGTAGQRVGVLRWAGVPMPPCSCPAVPPSPRLPLAELEPLPGARTTRLLALDGARIASHQAGGPELEPVLAIGLDQGPGDGVPQARRPDPPARRRSRAPSRRTRPACRWR